MSLFGLRAFQNLGKGASKFNTYLDPRRFKSFKSAILKEFGKPLVIEDAKADKKIKPNQVYF